MEPYRVSGFRCPMCTAGTPLREFHDRLICDECDGMFIAEADFVASCDDLASLDLSLTFEPGTLLGASACPRCERSLVSVRATLSPLKVTAEAMRCERDGLWLRRDVITQVFALISRRTHHHAGGRFTATGGRRGLDGLPMSRHEPASSSLAISQWSSRPRRRAQTATPVNLYRDQRLACPRCPEHAHPDSELRFFGDRYQCATCAGTFVQNAALQSMVMDIRKAPWDVPPVTGVPGTRPCPVCSQAMIVEDLELVPIDRCDAHGVWFDPLELTVTLERASRQFDPRGIRGWIKKLFTDD